MMGRGGGGFVPERRPAYAGDEGETFTGMSRYLIVIRIIDIKRGRLNTSTDFYTKDRKFYLISFQREVLAVA